MYVRCLTAVLSLVLLAAPAAAETRLTLQLKEGSEFTKKERISARQTLKLAGQTQETANQTTVVSKTVVGRRNEQGELPLRVTTTELISELTLPGGKKVVYNSATGEATTDDPNFQIILDRFKSLKGQTYTITLDENNRFKSVSGLDPESGAEPGDIQASIEQMLNRYPDKLVNPGDTWEREIVVPLGAGQVFKLQREFKYAGPEVRSTVTGTQRLEKVTAETKSIEYAIRPGGGIPGRVAKSDLKPASGEATFLFDPAQGRTVESHEKMHITGTFTLSIMNQDLSGELDLTMEMKSEETP